MFISFCGLDGCGKTTQAQLLKENLLISNKSVKIVHGFKPPVFSKELKNVANQLNVDFHELFSNEIRTFSFLMDLLKVIENEIDPYDTDEAVVIVEKYFLDTIIYAPLLGTDSALIKRFSLCIPEPDVYLFLDIDPYEAGRRTTQRSRVNGVPIAPKEEFIIASKAYDKYHEYANQRSEKFLTYNANLPVDELANKILKDVNKLTGVTL